MGSQLSWLHLSDLHTCKPKTGWDARRVLSSLLDDLRHMQTDIGIRPNFLFFTGDLAFGQAGSAFGENLPNQFDDGAFFLDQVCGAFSPSISKDNVFIVPGNHDVNRQSVTPDQIQWLDSLDSTEPVERMILSADLQWRRYMERLQEYRSFLENHEFSHLLSDRERLIYCETRNVDGFEVGIAGLNSAWSCCRNHENGKLWLGGRFQAEDILARLDGVDFSIALIHHPGSWFTEYEKNPFWRHIIQPRFRFCLHGHEHDAWVESHMQGHNTIAAAACYDRSDRPNGYNFVRINLNDATGEVWLRKYSRAGGGGWGPEFVPTFTDERGVWPLQNLGWLRSRDSIEKTSPVDALEPGGSDEAIVLRTERESKLEVERLKEIANWHTQEEIRRTAAKKYMPELYIPRGTEETLGRILAADAELSRTLVRLRERLHNAWIGTAERIQSTTDQHAIEQKSLKESVRKLENSAKEKSAKRAAEIDKELQRKKERLTSLQQQERMLKNATEGMQKCYASIEGNLDAVLESGRPCDGQHWTTFSSLVESLDNFHTLAASDNMKDLRETAILSICSDALAAMRVHTSNVCILIDRAGGGKTNLLCHMAMSRGQFEPCVLVNGRLPVEERRSFVALLRKRLGGESIRHDNEWARELDNTLREARSHITVFVDGINECRNITMLNDTLLYAFKCFAHTRVRFVMTCRDIYWSFFETKDWTTYSHTFLKGELYEFSESEQRAAVARCLEHYCIKVELNENALERCKHPLLLRFFYEAYHKPTGDIAELGRIDEIRLKPLFDDYWRNKMQQLRDAIGTSVGPSPEQTIFALVRHMYEQTASSLSSDEFREATGVKDLDTVDSVYLRLLDEDIIIEERPADSLSVRRVLFVYEEFMEYTIARELFHRCVMSGHQSVDELFDQLNGRLSDFVNVLGVGEYICAFCLDNGLYKKAFDLVGRMGIAGDAWDEIVANVFNKYDQSLDIILTLELAELKHTDRKLKGILESLGRTARPALAEVCTAAGFWLIFPNILSIDDLIAGKHPPIRTTATPSIMESDGKAGMTVLRAVGQAVVKANLNPIREQLWKRVSAIRKGRPIDLREVVRALWGLVGVSSRKDLLASYACNGLFCDSIALRRAAALITKDSRNRVATEIRTMVREQEADEEVVELLS